MQGEGGPTSLADLAALLRRTAHPIRGAASDYDLLFERLGDARLVLIGESSRGTHEFFRERARITRRLIEQKGFGAVALTLDWSATYGLNRYARGIGADGAAAEAMADAPSFPDWLWRNRDMVEFLRWLRAYNARRSPRDASVGFYGLDIFGLYSSMEAVITELDVLDRGAAGRAREEFSLPEPCGDGHARQSLELGIASPHEDQLVARLLERRRLCAEFSRASPLPEDESLYSAVLTAVIADGERYYRSLLRNRLSAWNLRQQHMAAALTKLLDQQPQAGRPQKVVVWAHSMEAGDPLATELGRLGAISIGQMARTRFGQDAFSVGITTFGGTVTAASSWGAPAERKSLHPALPESQEALFHAARTPLLFLALREDQAAPALRQERLQRVIGAVYRPRTERVSHYLAARLVDQFDFLIHLDDTRAMVPLHYAPSWVTGDTPERPSAQSF